MVRIVVGVDGSTPSKEALRWAVDEARLRGATLRVVSAWTIPIYVANGLAPIAIPNPTAVGEATHQRLDSVLSEIVGDSTDVPIEEVVVEGTAPEILLEESKEANLLVVGSRGHGGFTGLLLGSVSQQCATHASCPVVIVRGAAAS